MLQPQGGHRFGHAPGLVEVDCVRLAFWNRAESAPSRAQVPQEHESSSAMIPAFSYVGTLRRLAHCMEIELPSQLLELVIIIAHRRASLQPLRLRLRNTRGKIDLNELGAGGHSLFLLYPRPRSEYLRLLPFLR